MVIKPERPKPWEPPAKKNHRLVETILSPKNLYFPRLAPGAKLYLEGEVHLTRVAKRYRNLRCFTTQEASGDNKQGVVLTLSEPSEVFIAHDQRVKRRPKWLSTFLQTGDTLEAAGAGEASDGVTYLLYRKKFSAGTLALGANTAANRLSRVAKKYSGRSTFMYLVCFPTSGGSN